MKKNVLAISLIILIGIASGCLGGSSPATTPSTSTTSSTTHVITTSTSTTTTTTTPNPLQSIRNSIEGINQFTYDGNTSIHMNVTVLMPNLTQNNTIALFMHEKGYIDLSSLEAVINTTTVTEPDNTTLTTIRVIKNGKTYLKTVLGSGVTALNVTNNVSTFIWEYNPVSLAKRYINETPDKVVKNGETTQLIYTLNWQDVKALAILYLAITNDTGIKIKGGKLILTFEGNDLREVKIEYSVIATSIVKNSLLGPMTIKINAKGFGEYRITSINKKMEVKPPTKST